MSMQVRQVDIETILPLRHEVLRAGLPMELSRYPQDREPGTLHLAATAGERAVGCVSCFVEPYEDEPAWRIRGMAVEAALRGRGVGAALLTDLERRLLGRAGPELLWCNARTSARGFYRRQGWAVVSDVFEIEAIGPHVRMTKRLGG